MIFQTLVRYLFFFCLLSVQYFYSQNKFIISPEFSLKTSIAFVDPSSMNNNERNFLENQFISKPYAITYSARVIKHQTAVYGLSIGYIYKNNTRFLKLSYTKDIASFRTFSHFRSYSEPSYYGMTVNYYGVGFHRFLTEYGLKIPNKSKNVQSWFSIGAGININRNRWTGLFPFSWNVPLSPNGDELLRTYIRTFEENRVNAFLKIGFDHDLYLKNKYIFSLKFQYIQGFGIISRVEYVHEYNLNGAFVYDGTGLMSRGSGFYWGINRRFQVYPWKINRKKSL